MEESPEILEEAKVSPLGMRATEQNNYNLRTAKEVARAMSGTESTR